MATFQAQVEALTGQSIGSGNAPSTAELTQFLNDGVIDVTNRTININPALAMLFQTESDEQDTNNSYTVKGKILSIVREAGVDNNWEKCSPFPNDLEWRVQDPDSLEYATKFNPVYIVRDNGKISVFPAPSASVDKFKVYYISNHPENDQDAGALVHTSYDIRNFPREKTYLVVIYAAIKSINKELAKLTLPSDLSMPVLNVLSTSLPVYTEPADFVMPGAPADVNVDFSELGSIDTFIAPTITAPTLPSPGALEYPPAPVPPVLNNVTIDESGITNPNFIAPIMDMPDWDDTERWIGVEEDPEMLAARVTEINSKIQEYSTRIQNSVAEFNKEAEILKKDLQVALTNSSFEDEKEKRALQKYSSDINKYQQESATTAQKWLLSEWTPKWEEFQLLWQSKLGQYGSDISKETSKVQASLNNYNAKVQKAISKYSAETGADLATYQQKITAETSRFNSDLTKNSTDFQNNLQKYQSEIQKVSSENQDKISLFSTEIQDYTAKIQKYRTDYEWMQGQYAMLKKDYDDAFMIAGSRGKQQGER